MISPSSIVIDKVIEHLREYAFGSGILTDDMTAILSDFLIDVNHVMDNLPISAITIKQCLEVASSRLKHDVSRMKRTDNVRLAFETAFVMLFMRKPEHQSFLSNLIFKDLTPFFEKYPEFQTDIDDLEISLLLTFRNVMAIAQSVIPAKKHKNQLLDIVTRITEGRSQKYVTGSGQTEATSRRVLIFSREGDVQPIPRRNPKPRLFPEMLPQDKMERITRRSKQGRSSSLARMRLTSGADPSPSPAPSKDKGEDKPTLVTTDDLFAAGLFAIYNDGADVSPSPVYASSAVEAQHASSRAAEVLEDPAQHTGFGATLASFSSSGLSEGFELFAEMSGAGLGQRHGGETSRGTSGFSVLGDVGGRSFSADIELLMRGFSG